jgi:hypothetical protein
LLKLADVDTTLPDAANTVDAVLARNAGVRFIVPPCKGAVLG